MHGTMVSSAFISLANPGWTEILIVLAISVVVFGPKPLRDLLLWGWRSLLSVRREIRDLKDDIRDVGADMLSGENRNRKNRR